MRFYIKYFLETLYAFFIKGKFDHSYIFTKERVISDLKKGIAYTYLGKRNDMFTEYWVASDRFWSWRNDSIHFDDRVGIVTEIECDIDEYFKQFDLSDDEYRNFINVTFRH